MKCRNCSSFGFYRIERKFIEKIIIKKKFLCKDCGFIFKDYRFFIKFTQKG